MTTELGWSGGGGSNPPQALSTCYNSWGEPMKRNPLRCFECADWSGEEERCKRTYYRFQKHSPTLCNLNFTSSNNDF